MQAWSWYVAVLKKYATFDGRARRAEYWWFALVNALIALALQLLDHALFGAPTAVSGAHPLADSGAFGIHDLYMLAMIIPSIAVSVRRLHDTGRSGWWLLIGLVPIIGFLVLLYFKVSRGDDGPNEYGEDPLANEHIV